MRAVGAACLAVFIWGSIPVEAALYEFTLEGTVSYTLVPNLSVGEPCIIRYSADDQDLNPDPYIGAFAVTTPLVSFPVSNTMFNFEPVDSRYVVLSNADSSGTGIDFLAYRSIGVIGLAWNMGVTFVFPDGILESDALPLTLPLQHAASTNFFMAPAFLDHVRGRITSYSSVAIPEPSTTCAILLVTGSLTSRRGSRRSTTGTV